MAISSNERQWQYYQRHQITAEGNLDIDPTNVISVAANTIVEVWPDDNDKGQIVKRILTNSGTAVIYVSISQFQAAGIAQYPLSSGVATSGNPSVPDINNYHFKVAVGNTLDLSFTDAAVYAICPTAALIIATFQAKRA